MADAINWFEIPVTDMERAAKFYSQILGIELVSTEMDGSLYAFLPADRDGVGGALAKVDGHTPSQNGTLIYLNGGDDLSVMLGRVGSAGGQVILPKTSIGENGFMAFFIDSEGNRLGIHSMN